MSGLRTGPPPAGVARMIARTDITGLLLAGGRGQRMGGVDKGLQPFRGRPLAAWSLERLQPQVGAMLINANQHPDDYEIGRAHV